MILIEIITAKYVDGYQIQLEFNDGKTQVVDFENFLNQAKNPMTRKYRDKSLFQEFKIEYGDLIWGDYEMCFPVADLYDGDI